MTFVCWVSSGRCSRQLIFPCSVSSCSCSTKTNQVQNKAAKVGQAYAPLISRPPQKYKISQLGHQEMPGRVKISPCMGLFYMIWHFFSGLAADRSGADEDVSTTYRPTTLLQGRLDSPPPKPVPACGNSFIFERKAARIKGSLFQHLVTSWAVITLSIQFEGSYAIHL